MEKENKNTGGVCFICGLCRSYSERGKFTEELRDKLRSQGWRIWAHDYRALCPDCRAKKPPVEQYFLDIGSDIGLC